jgi:hypothetical protein
MRYEQESEMWSIAARFVRERTRDEGKYEPEPPRRRLAVVENMTTLLAIDPGVHTQACALYCDATLAAAGFDFHSCGHLERVVVERPEYQGKRSDSARVQDLLALAWNGARFAAMTAANCGATLHELTPSQWKGSQPKPVVHAALWAILTPAEREILGGAKTFAIVERALERGAARRWPPNIHFYSAAWTMHNILDAAAMGAFYLGRLKK